ncbi:MAG TPA: acetyl-CoA carboxylase biotin carboxyl carrier protein subunit, partial [Lachnoclostridium sp.]|nr:acetyl-CoA carboxylase biotin carboxyl carrier protein subunit [Lachnoclostridium sp.]
PAPAPAPAAAGGEGSVVIESPMPGKILAIKAQPGTAVTAGQVILVLEAMKMENEIVAPQAGTVASVNVAVGEMVEPGAKLATMN